jgi:DNA-binding FadR family transcriptional regulator
LVDQIRRYIRDNGLVVGDVLPTETELATLFGSSRNTVREAIRTLKAYGLIESRKRVGAVITERRQEAIMEAFSFAIDLSAEAFQDVQGFRRLIEINVAEDLVLRQDQSYIEKAAAINENMRLALNDQLAGELDYEFHRTLVDALGNRTLSQIYAVMKPVICHLTVVGKNRRKGVESTAQDHMRILDALRRKDRIAIAYFYSVHLEAGLEYLPGIAAQKKNQSP